MPRGALDHEHAKNQEPVHYQHEHPVHPEKFPQKRCHERRDGDHTSPASHGKARLKFPTITFRNLLKPPAPEDLPPCKTPANG
jgi:hypothetical protein